MYINKTLKNIIITICFSVSVLIIYYINTQILLYADDYFYGTFFKDGMANFFKLTAWHYNFFNGRIFIHILIQITLIFDIYLFPAINVGFIIFISVYSYKLQNIKNHKNHWNFIVYTAFIFSSIMLLNVKILRESFLWVSGSFNYTLGAGLLFALFYLCKRYIQTNNFKWYAVITAFICGALTEQYGFAAMFGICVIGFGAYALKKFNKNKLKNWLFYLIPCIAGWFTVISSPATFLRMDMENPVLAIYNIPKIFAAFSERLYKLADMMNENGSVILFAMFGILTALMFLNDIQSAKRLSGFITGIVYSAIIVILNFFNYIQYINLISFYLSVCFLIFSAVIMLKTEKYFYTGIIIFAAFSSLFIMLMTNTIEFRVTFPFILFLIAAYANLFIKCVKIQNIALPVYVVISVIVFFPTVKGYHENKLLMDKNLSIINDAKTSEEEERIEFNIDFNNLYRHKLMYDDGYFYSTFCKYYDIDKDVKIYLTGGSLQSYTKNNITVYINGRPSEFEVYYIAGSNYFKLNDIARALNGTEKQFNIEWNYSRDSVSISTGKPYEETSETESAAVNNIYGEDNKTDLTDSPFIYSDCKTYLNGMKVNFMAYLINGDNYFKLRDIGKACDFNVTWNDAEKKILINTFESYTDE